MNHTKQQQFLRQYGPWAVVTGASSGIGRAFAIELARLGMNVVLVARNSDTLGEMQRNFKELGVEAKVLAADLSKPSEIERVHAQTKSLDVGLLIASAGFGTSGDFVDSTANTELNMLDVHCRALAANAHYFGNRLVQRGKGGMILLSSIVSFQGNGSTAHYSATKAYVQSLAEGLHNELRDRGVDVLSVAPGPTSSGFARRANMQLSQTISAETVARQSLAVLGRKNTILPGFLSKVLKYSMFGLPRTIRVRIMSEIMQRTVATPDSIPSVQQTSE